MMFTIRILTGMLNHLSGSAAVSTTRATDPAAPPIPTQNSFIMRVFQLPLHVSDVLCILLWVKSLKNPFLLDQYIAYH